MNIQQLKNHAKKIFTGHEPGINFYSQGGEDMILRSIFRKKINANEPGFYVDIGAYHPSYMSNTYFFYISGWRGINIDARPGSMKAFNKIRPQDVNLEIGIGEKDETLTYYMIDETSTMNSFSKEFLITTGMYSSVKKEVPVKVYSLSNVLDNYADKFSKIDILSVDSEGLDLAIMKSNNWNKYRPRVIVAELACTSLNDVYADETARYLCSLNYNIIAKNVVVRNVASVFFADKDYDY